MENVRHTQLTAAGTIVAASEQNRLTRYKLCGLLSEDITSSSADVSVVGAKHDDSVEIGSVTAASPGVITAPGHGLSNGNIVFIFGSDTTPTLDGFRTVAGVSGDDFNVGVNTTDGGTGQGTIYKTEEIINHLAFGMFEYPGPIGYHLGYYANPAGTSPSMTFFFREIG